MHLLHSLHRAQQIGDDLFTKSLNGHGDDITIRQTILLDAIKSNPGKSQTVLVAKTGIDRSTLADVVKRMSKKGLVHRRRTKDDARAYAVKLTEEGQKILTIATRAAQKAETALLAQVPAAKHFAA